jgi:Domain of unknown function (DUF6265)
MILAALAAVVVLADATADVARLSWMAGSWIEEKDGVTTRETWLSPKDGVMAGVGQTNRPGKPPYVEFTKISAEPAGATFSAMIPGQSPTPFVLVPGQDGEAVFENRTHVFPQRVIYRRCGRDLCARIEGTANGKLQYNEWRYRRAK